MPHKTEEVNWVRIFSSVGQMETSLVMNQPRLLLVEGKRICLVRTPEGLRAVADKCTHNGESLSKGTVNYLGEVVCPWHGQRFSLRTGRECSERSADLEVYHTRSDEEGVFVGL